MIGKLMKKKYLATLLLAVTHLSLAGEADNISACVRTAKEFSGVALDPFSASYTGNVLSMSVAKWDDVYCEVKLANVYNLRIHGQQLVYNAYAGKESYDLNSALQAKTEATINQMNSRIALLQQRASQVSVSLQKPNPNHKWLAQYVDEGIEKSLGKTKQAAEQPVIIKQNSVEVKKDHLEHSPTVQEVQIPRSVAGDKGTYYLLEVKRNGNVLQTLHKRIGVDSVGYTKTEVDCNRMLMKDLGYGEGAASNIRERTSDWFELIPGSSKSDLAHFVCR